MNEKEMLEFAYEMRNMWEKTNVNEKNYNQAVKRYREGGSSGLYHNSPTIPEYGKIWDVIIDLENELKYMDAKKSGKPNERKRTSAAKKILGEGSCGRKALEGYKDIGDGKIIICNGYILYEGDSVIGIPETPDPLFYPDFGKQWDINVVGEFELTRDDVLAIKQRMTEGRAETGCRRAANMIKSGNDNGIVFWKRAGKLPSAFNADYILWATDLLGGDKWFVKLGDVHKACIIEGQRGRALILPILRNKDSERIDKEVA